jgi:hypothetical protein
MRRALRFEEYRLERAAPPQLINANFLNNLCRNSLMFLQEAADRRWGAFDLLS